MTRAPNTFPIPAPEPATPISKLLYNDVNTNVEHYLPTVAAPAPMYLAAESISLRATVV